MYADWPSGAYGFMGITKCRTRSVSNAPALDLDTLWTPSHQGISGDEQVDGLDEFGLLLSLIYNLRPVEKQPPQIVPQSITATLLMSPLLAFLALILLVGSMGLHPQLT